MGIADGMADGTADGTGAGTLGLAWGLAVGLGAEVGVGTPQKRQGALVGVGLALGLGVAQLRHGALVGVGLAGAGVMHPLFMQGVAVREGMGPGDGGVVEPPARIPTATAAATTRAIIALMKLLFTIFLLLSF